MTPDLWPVFVIGLTTSGLPAAARIRQVTVQAQVPSARPKRRSAQIINAAWRTRAQELRGVREATLAVRNAGYSPNYIIAENGTPLKLVLVTGNTCRCAHVFTIRGLCSRKILPNTGRVELSPC